MGKIKDNLNSGRTRTVTLEKSELEYMQQMHDLVQAELDRVQNVMAANFLRYIAVNKHEYAPACDLRFNLDPTKAEDNLEITNVTK